MPNLISWQSAMRRELPAERVVLACDPNDPDIDKKARELVQRSAAEAGASVCAYRLVPSHHRSELWYWMNTDLLEEEPDAPT